MPENTVETVDLAPEDVAVVVEQAKKGWKTTEFWFTAITSLLVAFNGIPLPESAEGYVIAALAGLYAVSRGLAKKDAPAVVPLPPA